MASTVTYSARTWRYTSVSVVLTIPTVIKDGDTPKYFPQVFNPDGYTITRVRAMSGAVAVTDWYSGGDPYELTSLATVSEGTINLTFQIDTVEGGVFTTTSIPITVHSASGITVGQGTFSTAGQAPALNAAGADLLTVGQGEFSTAGQAPTLTGATGSLTVGQGEFSTAGQAPTLTGVGSTINNSVSASPNPADTTRDQVTLTCTLSSGALTPTAVKFYRDYVSTSDYGTLIGSGTQQSSTVWTFTSYYDPDLYDDVRSVVSYFSTDTVSFNEISFEVLPIVVGQGEFSTAGQAPTIGVGANTLTVGQGEFATAGQAPTLTGATGSLTVGQGEFATAGQAPTLAATPAGAGELTVGQGEFSTAGQGPTLTPGAASLTVGQGEFSTTGQAPTLAAVAANLTVGQGEFSTAGQAPTISAPYTARWAHAVTANDELLKQWVWKSLYDVDDTHDWLLCFQMHPHAENSGDAYVIAWGWDAANQDGYCLRINSDTRFHYRANANETIIDPISIGTKYKVSVYSVGGQVRVRVDGTDELTASTNPVDAGDTNAYLGILGNIDGAQEDPANVDLRNLRYIYYSGGSDLTTVRADIAIFEAEGYDEDPSPNDGDFTGTVYIAYDMGEESDGSATVTRVDRINGFNLNDVSPYMASVNDADL